MSKNIPCAIITAKKYDDKTKKLIGYILTDVYGNDRYVSKDDLVTIVNNGAINVKNATLKSNGQFALHAIKTPRRDYRQAVALVYKHDGNIIAAVNTDGTLEVGFEFKKKVENGEYSNIKINKGNFNAASDVACHEFDTVRDSFIKMISGKCSGKISITFENGESDHDYAIMVNDCKGLNDNDMQRVFCIIQYYVQKYNMIPEYIDTGYECGEMGIKSISLDNVVKAVNSIKF